MSALRAVRVDPTPNPEAMKFTVDGELVAGGPLTISDPAQAVGVPLAVDLLAVDGVARLFFLRDFVTVTRRPGADWGAIIDGVRAVITERAG